MLTTLKKRREFLNVKQLGKSWAAECFILQGVAQNTLNMSKYPGQNSPEEKPSEGQAVGLSLNTEQADKQTDLFQPESFAALPESTVLISSQARENADSAVNHRSSVWKTPSHIGYVATKKLGGAVVRNRAKRRLREASRACLSDFRAYGVDYVLIARGKITTVPFDQLLRDLKWALKHVHRLLDA